jgi:hypothetical protein
MFASGLPGYYVLYSLFTLSFLFLIRRKMELNRRDTGYALAFVALFGLILPISLHVIGIWWTLGLVALSVSSVMASVIAVRMREDRELEGEISQVLKPSVSILPVRDSENAPEFPPPPEPDDTTAIEEVDERTERSGTAEDTPTEETAEELPSLPPEDLAEPPEPLREDLAEPPDSPAETGEETAEPVTVHPFSPDDLHRVQEHYGIASESLRKGDYYTAYRELRSALSYHPPVTAKTMIVHDLVRVLKEMGLYKESIQELQNLLAELPASANKKQAEVQRHIQYMEAVVRILGIEQKPNLSWSLLPDDIHSRAEREVLMQTESIRPKEKMYEAEQRNIG